VSHNETPAPRERPSLLSSSPCPMLGDSWKCMRYLRSTGGHYSVYIAPDGTRCTSLLKAQSHVALAGCDRAGTPQLIGRLPDWPRGRGGDADAANAAADDDDDGENDGSDDDDVRDAFVIQTGHRVSPSFGLARPWYPGPKSKLRRIG